MKTRRILLGTEIMNLKKKIFLVFFFQVFIIIVSFLAITWLFFSEVSTEGTFWSGITRENVWKFILFLLVIITTYFVCGKLLVNKIRILKRELNIFLAKPQMLKNGGHF